MMILPRLQIHFRARALLPVLGLGRREHPSPSLKGPERLGETERA
jgi:hypothetical protein